MTGSPWRLDRSGLRAGLALASALLPWLVSAPPAMAGSDWRYCLATWEPTRAVYVTMPFPSAASLTTLEGAYSAFLTSRGLQHEPVICPRADTEQQALTARAEAIAYNRVRGLSASLASWRYEP